MFHETNLYSLLDSMIEVRKRSDDAEAFIELLPMKVFINNEISLHAIEDMIEDLNETIKFYKGE